MTVKVVQTFGGVENTYGPFPIDPTEYAPETGINQAKIDEIRDSARRQGASVGYAEMFICDNQGESIGPDDWEIIVL